jgi:chromosome segregation ATPase
MENVLESPKNKQDIMVLVGKQYLKQQKQKISELENELAIISTTLNRTVDDYDRAKTKINELEGNLKEKEGKNEAILHRNKELEANKEKFDKEILKINDEKKQFEIATQRLEIQLAAAKSQISKIEDEMIQKTQLIKDLEGQIRQLKNELDLRYQERNTLRNEITTLRDQNLELQKSSENVTGHAGQLEQSLVSANMQLKNLEMRLSNKEDQIQQLQQRDQANQSKIGELEAIKSGTSFQIARLEEKINEESKKSAELKEKLEEIKKQLENERQMTIQKINEFQLNNTSLKEEMAIRDGKIKELTGLIEIKDQKILEMERSFQLQGELLTQKEAEIKEWQAKFVELEVQLKGPEKEITEVTRLSCPKCHSNDVNKIENKKKVLSYIGYMPIYAKKYQCPKCGYIWE